jgi:hypothetical protein
MLLRQAAFDIAHGRNVPEELPLRGSFHIGDLMMSRNVACTITSIAGAALLFANTGLLQAQTAGTTTEGGDRQPVWATHGRGAQAGNVPGGTYSRAQGPGFETEERQPGADAGAATRGRMADGTDRGAGEIGTGAATRGRMGDGTDESAGEIGTGAATRGRMGDGTDDIGTGGGTRGGGAETDGETEVDLGRS